MAVGEEIVKEGVGVEEKEKWLMHYSSFHQILLVGDGDFSFSLCLARSFSSASNIVASALDPYNVVVKKYKKAKSNLEALKKLGAYLLFGVDATKMKLHTDLRMQKFDRIIFNFPHAGFHGREDNRLMINMHRELVHGFFKNASGMLRADGEIHVTHKNKAPFSDWNLEELASWNSLVLYECVAFKREDYPGYNNKRGAGSSCDEPFLLGSCSTFKFRFSPTAKKMSRVACHSDLNHPQQLNIIEMHQRPGSSSDYRGPGTNIFAYVNGISSHMGLPLTTTASIDFSWIFAEYLNQAVETFGRRDYDVHYNVHEGPGSSSDYRGPGTNILAYVNGISTHMGLPLTTTASIDCSRIFAEFFNHAEETFGRRDYDVPYTVREALRLGYERYMTEDPERTLTGYINLLEELQHLSRSRSAALQRMLIYISLLEELQHLSRSRSAA